MLYTVTHRTRSQTLGSQEDVRSKISVKLITTMRREFCLQELITHILFPLRDKHTSSVHLIDENTSLCVLLFG